MLLWVTQMDVLRSHILGADHRPSNQALSDTIVRMYVLILITHAVTKLIAVLPSYYTRRVWISMSTRSSKLMLLTSDRPGLASE